MKASICVQTRFLLGSALRATCFALALGCFHPAFAEEGLPEVQRLIKQGQYQPALDKVDVYLANKPKDAQGRFLRGLILTELNRSNEAITTFIKLSEDYPELPEPYNNLAVLYAQQKQYDKARTALEMAIRTHPSYAIAYENLGDVYAKLASNAYDKALQLDSSNSGAQNKLALIRDLITTSTKGSKPLPASAVSMPAPTAPTMPPVVAAAPVTAAHAPATAAAAPSATVVSTRPGAAAASKPAEPVAATPAPVAATSGGEEEIHRTISAWAEAWSRKDVKTYLSFYAKSFAVPDRLSRRDWEKQRENRIDKPGSIRVTFDTPQVQISGDTAKVKFRQHYDSKGFNSDSTKTMVLVKSGNKWLIQEENSR
jgi:tetratricopeptide (TPR) repeat protein